MNLKPISKNGITFPGLLLVILFFFALPSFVTSPFHREVLIQVGYMSMMALGQRLVMQTGQLTMAQGVFMGIGGYTSATTMIEFGFPFYISLPLAGLIAGAIAIVIGMVSMRLKGIYFFMVTFGLIEAWRIGMSNFLEGAFGGFSGIVNIPRPGVVNVPGLFQVDFTDQLAMYYLTWALAAITFIVMYRLYISRFGMIFRSIREQDVLTEHLGLSIMKYKVISFVIACFFAGLAGSIFAHNLQFILPQAYGIEMQEDVLFFAIIGGTDAFMGPIVGSLGLKMMTEGLRPVREYHLIVKGGLLIFVMLFMPGGLVSLPERIFIIYKKFRSGLLKRIAGQPATASGADT